MNAYNIPRIIHINPKHIAYNRTPFGNCIARHHWLFLLDVHAAYSDNTAVTFLWDVLTFSRTMLHINSGDSSQFPGFNLFSKVRSGLDSVALLNMSNEYNIQITDKGGFSHIDTSFSKPKESWVI